MSFRPCDQGCAVCFNSGHTGRVNVPDPIPLRATGNRVLLRRVKNDFVRRDEMLGANVILLVEDTPKEVLQLGEVVGLGSRWTADAPWALPNPNQRRTELLDGSYDYDWKPEQIGERPRVPAERFDEQHARHLQDLKVGDLVVFVNSRILDHFTWREHDILVYPGNWIMGLVTDSELVRRPEMRRYAPQPI